MFSELPDYRVVLLGYSLGAGVVPLIALALLQVLLYYYITSPLALLKALLRLL
jgi:hypothetical protein